MCFLFVEQQDARRVHAPEKVPDSLGDRREGLDPPFAGEHGLFGIEHEPMVAGTVGSGYSPDGYATR